MPMRTLALSAMVLGLFALFACDGGMMRRRNDPWSDWNPYPASYATDAGADAAGMALDAARPVSADAAQWPALDAGANSTSTQAPKDPSVDGQCPSYIGANGAPIWGCCSKFGVCGTFAANTCLLAVGTQIPLSPYPADDGGTLPVGRCLPPATK